IETDRGASDASRVNAPIRLEQAPPTIRHLGHVALEAVDFEGAVAWFTHQLGLVPSDVQVLADGTPALVFLRCDLGPTPAEHHTVVIARSVEDGMNHAAFAVDDLDAVAMGQTVMRAAGWRHAWGVGRHLMGSQIFDYWYDPWGALVEHYADSDRFDAAQPAGVIQMTRASIAQWGPPMPERFVNARLTPRRLLAIARGLRAQPSLTLKRLLLLRRALTER
ncbi:MAG: VOC family protein, partial [Myxococcales bacterium]|nr:VOC family protein [Myxococcales bacterium]